MSLSWRNKQLRIGLAPDRIYLTGAKSVDLPANDGSWAAPAEALGAALAGHKGTAAVVLADQFVRYALLGYNETLKTPEQWQALALHRPSHPPTLRAWSQQRPTSCQVGSDR